MGIMVWRLIGDNPPKNRVDKVDLWIDEKGIRVPDCMWRVPEHTQHKHDAKLSWCYFHGEWGEWVELSDVPSHWMIIEPPQESV